jgi:hypothetical protein
MATKMRNIARAACVILTANGSGVFKYVRAHVVHFVGSESAGVLDTGECQYLRRRFDRLPRAALRAKLSGHERRLGLPGWGSLERHEGLLELVPSGSVLSCLRWSTRDCRDRSFTRPVAELHRGRGSARVVRARLLLPMPRPLGVLARNSN